MAGHFRDVATVTVVVSPHRLFGFFVINNSLGNTCKYELFAACKYELFAVRGVLQKMSLIHRSLIQFGKSSARFTGLPEKTNCYFSLRRFSKWRSRKATIIVGAVSYCDSVSSIWEGMKRSFLRRGVDMDFILFTTYERQLEYLLSGHIDVAWNGPVAHARLQKLVGYSVPLGMRDVDRDFASCILSTKKSGVKNIKDVENKRLATGSFDSPQAYILPMQYLIQRNVDLSSVEVHRFDKDIGKWRLFTAPLLRDNVQKNFNLQII